MSERNASTFRCANTVSYSRTELINKRAFGTEKENWDSPNESIPPPLALQRAYKERVANLAPVADWLSGSWPKIGPVEAKM